MKRTPKHEALWILGEGSLNHEHSCSTACVPYYAHATFFGSHTQHICSWPTLAQKRHRSTLLTCPPERRFPDNHPLRPLSGALDADEPHESRELFGVVNGALSRPICIVAIVLAKPGETHAFDEGGRRNTDFFCSFFKFSGFVAVASAGPTKKHRGSNSRSIRTSVCSAQLCTQEPSDED